MTTARRSPPFATTEPLLLTMLTRFTNRRRHAAHARELYESIVTQSRRAAFFTAAGVPDDLEGRLELLLLHTAIALDILNQRGASPQLTQALTEAFVEDVDDNLREVGLSDLRIPAKVKRAAAALLERHTDYALARREGDVAFQAMLERHFRPLPGGPGVDVATLARLAAEEPAAATFEQIR